MSEFVIKHRAWVCDITASLLILCFKEVTKSIICLPDQVPYHRKSPIITRVSGAFHFPILSAVHSTYNTISLFLNKVEQVHFTFQYSVLYIQPITQSLFFEQGRKATEVSLNSFSKCGF